MVYGTTATIAILIMVMMGVAAAVLLTGSENVEAPYGNASVKETSSNGQEDSAAKEENMLYQPLSIDEIRSLITTSKTNLPLHPVVTPDVMPQRIAADVMLQASSENAMASQNLFYTGTNVQVEGVDELDWVKTNGTHLFFTFRDPYSGGAHYLAITRVYPPEQVGIVLKFRVAESREQVQGIFLVDEGRTVVLVKQAFVERGWPAETPPSRGVIIPPPRELPLPVTVVETYSIGGAGAEKVDSKNITGRLVGARLYGGNLALVVGLDPYTIWLLPDPLPMVNGDTVPLNRTLVWKGPVDTYTTMAVYNPESHTLEHVSILTPPVQRIYLSSSGSLYIFAQEWSPPTRPLEIEVLMPYLPPDVQELVKNVNNTQSLPQTEKDALIQRILDATLSRLPPDVRREVFLAYKEHVENMPRNNYVEHTIVYKAQISGDKIIVLNTTSRLPGRLLDQFAIHEAPDGVLVVATTANVVSQYKMPSLDEYLAGGWGIPPVIPIMTTVNNVYTLDPSLKPLGALEGLAEGERIYSARYIGDYLFLVTFRFVDPLFAINLTDPTNPSVVGQLKIPGFSEYMHPVGRGLLLGVGMHTDDNGRPLGLKISLFNITDPLNPGLLDEIILENKPPTQWLWSPVLEDHKAFTYDKRVRTAFIPVKRPDTSWVLVVGVQDYNLVEKSRLVHNAVRTVVVEDIVVTIGPRSLRTWSLDSLELVAELKFA